MDGQANWQLYGRTDEPPDGRTDPKPDERTDAPTNWPTTTGEPLVLFVCWGNICRSPMAEMVARKWATRKEVRARFASAGVSAEEQGHDIDPRAAEVLAEHGYQVTRHVARKVTKDDLAEANLIVGMEQLHLDRVELMGASPSKTYLLSDFDRDAPPGIGIPDPWYGPESGFQDTLASIEAAMPELMRRIVELSRRDQPE